MLTVNYIVNIYLAHVDVIFLKRCARGIKSEWDPAIFTIFMYKNNLESKEDRDINLLYEFIHARDEIIRGIGQPIDGRDEYNCTNYEKVERKAHETYDNAPLVSITTAPLELFRKN